MTTNIGAIINRSNCEVNDPSCSNRSDRSDRADTSVWCVPLDIPSSQAPRPTESPDMTAVLLTTATPTGPPNTRRRSPLTSRNNHPRHQPPRRPRMTCNTTANAPATPTPTPTPPTTPPAPPTPYNPTANALQCQRRRRAMPTRTPATQARGVQFRGHPSPFVSAPPQRRARFRRSACPGAPRETLRTCIPRCRRRRGSRSGCRCRSGCRSGRGAGARARAPVRARPPGAGAAVGAGAGARRSARRTSMSPR